MEKFELNTHYIMHISLDCILLFTTAPIHNPRVSTFFMSFDDFSLKFVFTCGNSACNSMMSIYMNLKSIERKSWIQIGQNWQLRHNSDRMFWDSNFFREQCVLSHGNREFLWFEMTCLYLSFNEFKFFCSRIVNFTAIT